VAVHIAPFNDAFCRVASVCSLPHWVFESFATDSSNPTRYAISQWWVSFSSCRDPMKQLIFGDLFPATVLESLQIAALNALLEIYGRQVFW